MPSLRIAGIFVYFAIAFALHSPVLESGISFSEKRT